MNLSRCSQPGLPKPSVCPAWIWQARRADVSAEAQARVWLGAQLGVEPQAVPLVRDDRQRPRLTAAFAQHDCSWSHSGDGLLIALGNGMQVGIDLEQRRSRPRALALAQRFFSASEAQWLVGLHEGDARELAFLRLWCAKEAVLKAHGHGLSFGLDRLCFEADDDVLRLRDCDPALGAVDEWSVQELTPAPGHVGALAWRLLRNNDDGNSDTFPP